MAMPIFNRAKKAVESIDKNMINELKSFTSPASGVKIVCEAMCLMFGEKEEWDQAKRILGKMSFFEELKNFNPDTVTDRRWTKLR